MRLIAILKVLCFALPTGAAREGDARENLQQKVHQGESQAVLSASRSRLRHVSLLRKHRLGLGSFGTAQNQELVTGRLMPDEPEKILPAVQTLEKDAEKKIIDTKETVVEDVSDKLKQAKDGPTNPVAECFGAAVCVCIIACVVLVSLADSALGQREKSKAKASKTGQTSAMSSPTAGSRGWFQTMDSQELSEEFASVLEGIALNNLPGQFGLSLKAQEANLGTFGLNKMTPPVKPSAAWLLMKQVFGGVFNSLLWFCVTVEIALASFMGADESDLVTPAILASVITMAGTLQWWTERQAESMMSSLQQMQSAESVAVCRGGALDNVESEQLVPGIRVANLPIESGTLGCL